MGILGGQGSSYGASSIPVALHRSASLPGLWIEISFKRCQEKPFAALLSSIIDVKLRFPLSQQLQPA